MLNPEVENPALTTEYRPIACYNTLYKCIFKMLCVSLTEILPGVDRNQFAYIEGRFIIIYKVMDC